MYIGTTVLGIFLKEVTFNFDVYVLDQFKREKKHLNLNIDLHKCINVLQKTPTYKEYFKKYEMTESMAAIPRGRAAAHP